MKIEVFFEQERKFRDRIITSENRISLFELVNYETQGDALELLMNNFKKINPDLDIDTLIIETSDCSAIVESFFENIERNINIITSYLDLKSVLVNNPPKILLNKLERMNECTVHNKKDYFGKPSKSELVKIRDEFDTQIVGQEYAKEDILRSLVTQYVRKNKKPLVLMFYGNPGIGKTETAKYLADELFDTNSLIREQMTMTGGESSVNYFKSSNIRADSFSKTLIGRNGNIILLDEFALADEFFTKSFFQMFDEGIYEDGNFEVNVENAIIICTSNLLTHQEMQMKLGEALYSRFDGFIKFEDFSTEERVKVAEITLSKIINELNDSELISQEEGNELLSVLTNVIDDDASNGLKNFRSIRRFAEDLISDKIMNKILNDDEQK